MIDTHKAIRAIYSNVVTIDGAKAYDKDGVLVSIDMDAVNSWVDKEAYKLNRALNYPSIEDQLDDIYHNGVDGWKTTIKAVKDKYPK